ncbi:Putative KHG/KDPG aldolase [Frondihabitans sp. 762G35]|uniref:bifunctional 4-hydroxy-2-oxoglutarate aldolase/2-dehydro-3-deoxy-phosphogluconate aldolase n=1 Tax=Frondihabitans sp. 762G35 TaxID=1446794 RepID=UPI000D216432|nr:bifunctional 4-hydroxy-2-oxoglutarate aldolase/2-dehydro-3-deoxy-phosphogluconate aldolase [Frondihabitans sp. 762G35]ARC57891.1 Putative KHG/KDPG aldolase [Frondihabitans sp. 762G35]
MTASSLDVIGRDRAVVVIRADTIPDTAALVHALVEGGIHGIEFTFTTPDVERHVRAAVAAEPLAVIGVGTVLRREQALTAVEAGARFLVTPGILPEIGRAADEAGVALAMGAFTPSEVMQALEHGAEAVKIFPAESAGPRFFSHLRGPLPGVKLIASGGIDEGNARAFLDAGAYAVTAGSSVVTPALIDARDWSGITRRARSFVAALSA